ncbi:hypothetical protein L1987_15130 [Smallanthus sonchifolius]|uniref:Uncharacterized protein n=1 Tax=Smallanthus sonchifolius TaxID=185202 RepID=A0ACB9J5R3_9ASTR|nr:hypothetical protein L1987_15130 [Smallanthus sonchifolius]
MDRKTILKFRRQKDGNQELMEVRVHPKLTPFFPDQSSGSLTHSTHIRSVTVITSVTFFFIKDQMARS